LQTAQKRIVIFTQVSQIDLHKILSLIPLPEQRFAIRVNLSPAKISEKVLESVSRHRPLDRVAAIQIASFPAISFLWRLQNNGPVAAFHIPNNWLS
jgi:hypothetical protein